MQATKADYPIQDTLTVGERLAGDLARVEGDMELVEKKVTEMGEREGKEEKEGRGGIREVGSRGGLQWKLVREWLSRLGRASIWVSLTALRFCGRGIGLIKIYLYCICLR